MTAAASPTESLTVTGQAPAPKSHFWAGTSFSFHDLLDTINPLQHLPIIAPIYRAITGDTIGNVARVVGDGLFGGPIGAASGAVEVAVVETTGEDIGQHLIDIFTGGKSSGSGAAPAMSQPSPAPAASAPAAAPTPAYLSALPQAPKSPSILPQGKGDTSAMLAAAAPTTPLDIAQMVAKAQSDQGQSDAGASAAAAAPPKPAQSGVALGQPAQGIPIDVTPQGIAKMRATSSIHNPAPVALSLPPGMVAPGAPAASAASAAPASVDSAPPDFVARMKDGLAKYDALMAAQPRAGDGGGIDQSH